MKSTVIIFGNMIINDHIRNMFYLSIGNKIYSNRFFADFARMGVARTRMGLGAVKKYLWKF